jgi:ATP-binding cassette subfamily B multidrug efflux pump
MNEKSGFAAKRQPTHRHGGPGGALGRPVEKAKDFRGTLRRLIKYLAPQRVSLIIVMIFAILSTIFTVVSPKILGNATNYLTDGIVAKATLSGLGKAQDGIKQMYAGLTQAETQAETQARAAVAQQFAAKFGGTVPDAAKQALADAQNAAAAQAKSAVRKAFMDKAGLDETSLSVLGEMAGIPSFSSTADYGAKADNVSRFISLGHKLPASLASSNTSGKSVNNKAKSMSQTDIDRAVKDIRETGGNIPLGLIGKVLLWLLAIYLLSSLFTFLMQFIMSSTAQKVVYDMRRQVDQKLGRLPLSYYDSHQNGEILSRMTNDIDTISSTLQQSLTQLITSVMQIIGYVIMMLSVSPILTLIVMLTLPMYIFTTMFIAKRSQKYFSAQQKQLGELSGHTEEMYTGHRIVKAFGHEEESVATFEQLNDGLYTAGWKAQFLSGVMQPVMNFISNIGYVIICVVGGIFVTQNRLNVGDITAFISYSRSFSMPIIQTANIANIIQSTIACAERVFEVLDEKEEIQDSEDSAVIESPRGDVAFEHVDFSYVKTEPLIKDMCLDVSRGETVAIVGPTGAGKTTLVNLLMRFYEIDGGRITFDGTDIRSLKRGGLRRMFGMVLQDTWLFSGTIEDNIRYGRMDATHDEIVASARAAHADHFIRSLPDGYNTVLGEEASNISQGERQLLTIARALLADPAVLILDEATSSVDTRTEVLIQKAMGTLMKGRTNFVIAHRLSTIRDAKMILVMNHGSIIEKGTHEELISKGGFYADMYMSQFSAPV